MYFVGLRPINWDFRTAVIFSKSASCIFWHVYTEVELRRSRLPGEVVLPDRHRIGFQSVKRSYFARVRVTGG